MTDYIQVVILCGGIGKRMFPITTDKSILMFFGLPLITHQINKAKTSGLKRFIIITNPANESGLKASVSAISDISVEFVIQPYANGMADALLKAAAIIGNKPFILFSSNDIFDTSAYVALKQEYKINQGYSSYLIAKKVEKYFAGGYLITNTKNEIENIIEKPLSGKEPSNLINIVLHLHTRPQILFKYLENTRSTSDDIYEKALNTMIQDKHTMKAVLYDNLWQPIKYPWHILETLDHLAQDIKNKISPKASISERAMIDGSVIIEENVRVMEGAIIRGPSYIGRNSVIGNNALIRESQIGENCVVGYGTEIKHSYIANNCWFHSNYIGDSVIEDNCSFGAGAVTANFRLDEQTIDMIIDGKTINTGHVKLGSFIGRDTKVGIHASIMPGLKIGANCLIGPHVYLNNDVNSNLLVIQDRINKTLPNKLFKIKKIDIIKHGKMVT